MASVRSVLALFAAGALVAAPAEAQAPRRLAVDWIMRGPELVGRTPSSVAWSPDGQWLYFQWLPPGSAWDASLARYRVRAVPGAVPESLTTAQADSLAPLFARGGSTSPDRRQRVVSVGGDLFLVAQPSGAIRRLTHTPGVTETDPHFDGAGRAVLFRRDQNLVRFDLATVAVTQLTDIRPGPAPDSTPPTGQRGFVAREERSLVRAVDERLARDSLDRLARQVRTADDPKPVYLAKGERVSRLVPSPDGSRALIVVTRPSDPRRTEVPNYVTESGYTEDIPGRTKVGDVQPRQRVGVLRIGSDSVTWLDPLPGDSSGVYVRLDDRGWNDDGTAVLLWVTSRDYNERRLLAVDTAGAITSLDVLRDSTWVGGVGGRCFGCAGWLPGRTGAWFVSEEDGYAHLYTVGPDGSGKAQRTRGQWEVLSAELTADRSAWALHTSEASPFERQFYLLPVSGGPARRLTKEVGGHEVELSPDGSLLADVFSTANHPPELYLQPATLDGGRARLTTSPTAEWSRFPWIKPEIVWVPASDGVKVPARIYRPADLHARPNGAGVIFVHGAGYLHNVHRYWSDYFREYMFNQLLAQRGYVVLDLDYRASAGYGRAWREAIYRHMGGRDLQDQVDGARYLNRRYGVSFDRIGIYGGSYGGFLTLMALFRESKYFGAGAALRSVTDWAHYNHGYTAAILNEPEQDSVAFRQSSPIYFAEGLEDPLLMAHGMVDVNVHFQDIVRLTQRLIELGKTNWELAVYPVESHGFVRPDSWTDEYRRILALFDRSLQPKP